MEIILIEIQREKYWKMYKCKSKDQMEKLV